MPKRNSYFVITEEDCLLNASLQLSVWPEYVGAESRDRVSSALAFISRAYFCPTAKRSSIEASRHTIPL